MAAPYDEIATAIVQGQSKVMGAGAACDVARGVAGTTVAADGATTVAAGATEESGSADHRGVTSPISPPGSPQVAPDPRRVCQMASVSCHDTNSRCRSKMALTEPMGKFRNQDAQHGRINDGVWRNRGGGVESEKHAVSRLARPESLGAGNHLGCGAAAGWRRPFADAASVNSNETAGGTYRRFEWENEGR